MSSSSKPRKAAARRRSAPSGAERADQSHLEPASVDPEELQERLLEQIAQGGKLCADLEGQLDQYRCPELETIIKLHRVLALRLSAEADLMPDRFKFLSALMKPILELARLEEKRKQRELAERKYRDEVAARQAGTAAGSAQKVLTPETLQKIERELKLF